MPATASHITPSLRAPLGLVLGYLGIALAMTWPLVLHLQGETVGYPNVDAMDTTMLHGLVADVLAHPWRAPWTDHIYFPTGFPVLHLTPNLLDHLTVAPLVWALPFPLADNLWWLAVLVLNGLSAHRLGRRLGGTQASGWLAGIAFILAAPAVREANLHHAPQAMLFWAPLYLDALLSLRARPSPRGAALTALWLSGAALSYWYYGLFLALGSAPLLWGLRWRDLGIMAALGALLCGPWLAPQLLAWGDLPLTSGVLAPAPANAGVSFDAIDSAQIFLAQHGNDLLWWLRPTPLDVTNRVSLILVLGAMLGARRTPARTRWALVFMILLGGTMLLGPYLRQSDQLWLSDGVPISLPFHWLGQLHPVLARLTWPERWGMLVPLGLVALAARAPGARWIALGVLVESFALSGNLPLQTWDLSQQRCWSQIEDTSGAILVLPLRRGGLAAPRVGVQQRFHRRPVVNPVLLPPGATAPKAWRTWLDEQPMLTYLRHFEQGEWPDDPGAEAVRSLREAGVTAIALDVEPGGVLTPGGINRYQAGLGRHLGKPVDLGCALVWWLDTQAPRPPGIPDGDQARKRAADWDEAHPAPELQTLIRPTWNAIQRTQDAQ